MFKKTFAVVAVVAAFVITGVASAVTAADLGSTTLRFGSTGMYVSNLQAALNTITGSTLSTDGKFGNNTKFAVMSFQSSHSLTADGVVGPLTKTAIVAASTATPVTPSPAPTPGPNDGTEGIISDMNTISQYSNEEIGAGQNDVKVLGVEVEASNEGDIALKSIKVRFDSTGNNAADSDRITDYLDKVTVWEGSEEVGSASTDDFYKESTGIYTKTITLSGANVAADDMEKFYITVDAVSNLDSADIDSDSWTIALDSVRFVDGSGVVTTETTAIPTDMDWDSAGDGIGLAFVSFSSASDTELKISSNNNPKSEVVQVSTSADTDNVTLLKGKLTLDGTSDVWLDELPVTLTSTGDSIDALASEVTLTIDGEEFTESLGANCATSCASQTTDVVTFDNLDMTIDAGSTVNFTVSAKINDLENTGVTATDFDAGDTLLASVTTTNRGNMIAENEEGDQLVDGTEMTGSLTGNAQAFYSTGIQVELVSVTNGAISVAQIENQTDNATTTFVYDVTAFGADIYVDGTVTEDGDGTYAAGQGNSYYITRADTGADAASLTTPAASLTTNATSAANTTWLVEQGTTERFTLTVNVANTLTDNATNDALLFQTAIKSIGWDTSAIAATTNNYTFNLVDFKNTPVLLGELDAA